MKAQHPIRPNNHPSMQLLKNSIHPSASIPPEMHAEKTIVSSEGVYYKIPFYVSDNKLDIIVSMGTKWNIQG